MARLSGFPEIVSSDIQPKSDFVIKRTIAKKILRFFEGLECRFTLRSFKKCPRLKPKTLTIIGS